MWVEEQFVHGLSDDRELMKIIWELTALKDTGKVTSNQVLVWARQVEAQKTQTAVINNLN